MKLKRLAALACAVLLTGVSLVSCSGGSWKGYEESDLSKFVKVGQYKGVNVLLNTEIVTDDEIQAKIDEALVAAKYEEEITDRPVELGDHVKFNYIGIIDNVADPNFLGQDVVVQVGTNAFYSQLGDIEISFIGHSAGDVFKVNGSFPENYTNDKIENSASYAGKTITFEITLTKVFNYVLPELNDDFVKQVSSTSTTVAEYREELRNQIIEEHKENLEQQKMYGSWAAVMDTVEVLEYPKSELEAAKRTIEDSYVSLAQSVDKTMTLENYVTQFLNMTMDKFNEQILEYAKNTVTEQLVLHYIAQQENLSISDEEYQNTLIEYADKYGFLSTEEFENFYGADLIRQSMLFDKVIKLIMENAHYTEVKEMTE